jgi:replicative DNA helicase
MSYEPMPHSADAEMAYLGCLLIDPPCIRETDISPEDFYVLRNRYIFESIHGVYSKDSNFDILTISEELERRGQLSEIGGQNYLLSMINQTPSSLNYKNYSKIIKDKAQRRKLLGICSEMAKAAYNEEVSINDTVSRSASNIVNIARPDGGAIPIGAFVSSLYDDVIQRSEKPKEIYGISTGIKSWDTITKGNQRGEETLIAARPNVGKTIFLTQMAVGMANEAPGVFYEMEMGGIAVVRRVVSWLGKIPTTNMKSGFMSAYINSFASTIEKVSTLKIFLSDETNWDTASLRADLARLKREGIQWFCLDYMLLLKDDLSLGRNDRIDNISQRLHDICKDLNLAGIVVHTLNKAGYGDEADLQHLGGTAGVSYDADNVVFMSTEKDSKVVEFSWAKVREAEGNGFMRMVKIDGIPAFGEIQK